MTSPRVKICGITRLEDAERAAGLGAMALGFVLWSGSPRAITPRQVRAIARALPAGVARVGVVVEASPDEVRRLVGECELDVVQLHGSESVGDYADLGARLIKAVALESDAAVRAAADLPEAVTVLVDAGDPIRRGGTGRIANWDRAAALARRRPVILAGGLSAANVRDAVLAVQPWAIDVSSGVESAPGVKDPQRLDALFATLNEMRP